MLLSIIIPMYNAEPYINQCLDSIFNQGIDPETYEVLIINDGSSDKSQEIVEGYLNFHSNLKIISQVNKGQSAARNLGISMACGDYLQFVDADDYLIPDSLHQIVEYAQSLSDKDSNDMIAFGIIGGIPGVAYTNKGSGKCMFKGSGYEYIGLYNYNNGPWYYWLSRAFISRIELNFVQGKLCEDGMFTLTALLNAKSIAQLDTTVYFYAIRPNSTTKSTNPERRRKLVEGFTYAINYFDKMIDEHSIYLNDKGIRRIITRRDSYIFFLLIRLLKLGAYHDAKCITNIYKERGIYPIRYFIGEDYQGIKLKIITYFLNRRQIYLMICKIKNLIS